MLDHKDDTDAMPTLRNSRHERFAQLLASGETATDAYEEAGYKRSDSNGPALARTPEICRRVAEMNGIAAQHAAITKEKLIEWADEIRREARERGQYSAAIAALKEIGTLTGLRIERSERGSPHEFSELSDADLLKELREMGYRIEVDAPPTHGMN